MIILFSTRRTKVWKKKNKKFLFSFVYEIGEDNESWFHGQGTFVFMSTDNFLFMYDGTRLWILSSSFSSWNGFAFKDFISLCCWSFVIFRRSKADVEGRSFFDVEILSLLKADVRVEVDVGHRFSSSFVAILNLWKIEDRVIEGLIRSKIEVLYLISFELSTSS